MSNFTPWYYAGILVLGASLSYIVVSAVQFIETTKKYPKSHNRGLSGPGPTRFLRHALVAFIGIIIGAQLIQYHQEQEEMVKKDITKDMAMAQALSSKPSASLADSKSAVVGMGARPTNRPTRGFFGAEEAKKTNVTQPTASAQDQAVSTPASK